MLPAKDTSFLHLMQTSLYFSLICSCLQHIICQAFSYDGTSQFACGELLEIDKGNIESPLFPEPYPPEVDCTWYIRVDPDKRIHFTSEYFYVEHQQDCSWDYLLIQDGEDGKYGQAVHCGSDGLDFLSTSNIVTLHFHSDVSNNDAGFRIHYESISTQQTVDAYCNSTSEEEGFVTSPFFPVSYPANTFCLYHIVAPGTFTIALDFIDFEVETSPCYYDKLEIFDGESGVQLVGTFCGREPPENVTSQSNVMTMKLTSDSSLQSRGFNVSFTFLPSNTAIIQTVDLNEDAADLSVTETTDNTTLHSFVHSCNSTVTVAQSNVSSPGFPNVYPHNTHCVTKLRSDVISTFFIRFLNFSIEEGENCTFDYLSIMQAFNLTCADETRNVTHDPAKHLVWHKCGSDLTDHIITWIGYGLDLVFHSDRSVTDLGYLAQVVISPVGYGTLCPDVCENGGTCEVTLLSDGSEDWLCVCREGFTGTLCDVIIQPTCDQLVCVNGAICAEDLIGPVCMCRSGYTGDFCERYISNGEGGTLFFTKMVSNTSVSVGSSVILECAVNDDRAHVMWLFHDRILTNADWSNGVEVHPGGVVVIPEVRDEHSGRYTCMAVTADDLVERSAWIDLTEPCKLDVTNAPANITVREGQAAMFQCYVPDADVLLWRKDGDLISQGPRKRILVNHYLVINPVVETDAGQYTCAARGANGCFSKSSAHLTVETTGHGKECGLLRIRPKIEGTQRISSGHEAPKGSAPWHVVLREERKDTTFCGGSLISPDTVLTAAHCILQFEAIFGYPFHPRHIAIYLGTHHCVGDNGIYRQLKSYVTHAEFNNTYYSNDIALLKLDSPVTYSDDVMPICLERLEFVDELVKPGRLGTITGCGGRHAMGIPPEFLHQVQIPLVPREICKQRAAAVHSIFTPGMFCAGYARSMRGDACAGDSGGPYVLQYSGRSIQVGVVSWGVGCDRENHYGYYTHVAHYYDWIIERL